MKDFGSLDQNALAVAISKIIFPLFFPLLPAQTGLLQTATMKAAGNARQREEMDLAQTVRRLLWDVLMEHFSPAMDLGSSLH